MAGAAFFRISTNPTPNATAVTAPTNDPRETGPTTTVGTSPYNPANAGPISRNNPASRHHPVTSAEHLQTPRSARHRNAIFNRL
ncbi:hypothetical protein GCM10009745_72630 [Kribbella yunnanensis]|uniref:Uncharacterized protein n=1 Tax=Kribbella yunnanensis TaxID=190194 RepID=A0ABN2IXQ3_9ACTN